VVNGHVIKLHSKLYSHDGGKYIIENLVVISFISWRQGSAYKSKLFWSLMSGAGDNVSAGQCCSYEQWSYPLQLL